jgi:hypothetical protein
MHACGYAMSTVIRFIRCRSQGRELIAVEGVLLVKMPGRLNREIALARPETARIAADFSRSGMRALARKRLGVNSGVHKFLASFGEAKQFQYSTKLAIRYLPLDGNLDALPREAVKRSCVCTAAFGFPQHRSSRR